MTEIDVGPVVEFLDSLDTRLRAKVLRGVSLLARHWPLVSETDVKRVHGYFGLWELRERLGNTRVRLFFFQARSGYLVLVHGYVKKSDKAPLSVLRLAARKMAEFKDKE